MGEDGDTDRSGSGSAPDSDPDDPDPDVAAGAAAARSAAALRAAAVGAGDEEESRRPPPVRPPVSGPAGVVDLGDDGARACSADSELNMCFQLDLETKRRFCSPRLLCIGPVHSCDATLRDPQRVRENRRMWDGPGPAAVLVAKEARQLPGGQVPLLLPRMTLAALRW